MTETNTQPKHVYLVDGSGYIFRAYHALPPLTRADGTPVNAVLGFTTMLMKLISETDADHIAVIFDAARAGFRNEIYADYKANRPPPPEELIPQFALIREATRAFNLPSIEMPGYEADDLIATYARLAKAAGADVTIVSSDKDLMQLVNDRVTMFDPIKNKPIGAAEVEEKFGVGPDKVVEVQALAGDSTDNVPGVPGIGVKTAAELIKIYGDIENLLAHAAEIKQPKRREALIQNAEKARISRQLVLLKNDIAVDHPLASFARRQPDRDVLMAFLKENQFRSVITRLEGQAAPREAKAIVDSTSHAPNERAVAAGPAFDRKGYELVQTAAALDAWIARATEAGIVAFDTETTALDPMKGTLCGFSLAVGPGQACYVPVARRAPGSHGSLSFADAPPQVPLDDALRRLKPLLEDPGILKVGHNVKYDIEVMGRLGITVAPFDDSMLISYVLEGGAHGHGMDELAEIHLNHKTIRYEDVCGSGKSQVTFDLALLEQARDYAAEDADVTLRLCRLKPRCWPSASSRSTRPSIGRWCRSSRQWRWPASRSIATSSGGYRAISPSGWPSSRNRSTSSRAIRSTSARPSSWARCCSTRWDSPAARRARPAPTRPAPTCWRRCRRRATICRRACSIGASSRNSRAPTPTRWWSRSIRRPAACTPPSRSPPPRPAGSARTIPTCRTFPCARRRAARSAVPSWRRGVTSCCRSTIHRSSCGWPRTSPRSPR
jgi:DNA polymerase-1